MPLPMVHLSVAKEYTKNNVQLENCAEIFLGSISPDAIHMRENSNREDKDKTHLAVERKIYVSTVIEFLKENKNNTNYYFLVGYAIHILTDHFWHETIMKNFLERYNDNHDPIQPIRETYYNDTDSIDLELYDSVNWRSEVWEKLHMAKVCAVDTILSIDEIQKWNLRTLSWYDRFERSELKPRRYIIYDEVLEFSKDIGRRIVELFEAEGI